MDTSKPEWVNSIQNIIKVNSLLLGGLHIKYCLFNVKKRLGKIKKNEKVYSKLVEYYKFKKCLQMVSIKEMTFELYIIQLISPV